MARDRLIQYGCRWERSRLKARWSALRSTVFRLNHALISTERMIEVSAAQFPGWTSRIAIFLVAPKLTVGQHICDPPAHSPSIRRVTHRASSACRNNTRTFVGAKRDFTIKRIARLSLLGPREP